MKLIEREKNLKEDDVDIMGLISGDGDRIGVKKTIAKQSVLIKTMLDDAEDEDIPLPQVCTEILKKVVVYLEYIVDTPCPDIEKPLKTNNIYELTDKWFADYIDIPTQKLMELMNASNYLDIRCLLELACTMFATKFMGKSAQQIRDEFGIDCDLTPEELTKMEEENKWVYDES
jgi:S-phase kinase-associated protein 1